MKLIIKIGGDMFQDMKDAFYDPKKRHPGTSTIYLKNADELYRIFSPKRIDLLHFIFKNKRKSINEIAKALNRKQEAISRDSTALELPQIIKKVRKGQNTYLETKFDSFEVSFA